MTTGKIKNFLSTIRLMWFCGNTMKDQRRRERIDSVMLECQELWNFTVFTLTFARGPVNFKSTHPAWQLEIKENFKNSAIFFLQWWTYFVTLKPIWVKYQTKYLQLELINNKNKYISKYTCNPGELNLIWASQFRNYLPRWASEVQFLAYTLN